MSVNCTKDFALTVTDNSLAAFFRMNEVAGNTRTDSKNGNVLTNIPIFGDFQSTAGKISSALRLNIDAFPNGPAFSGNITPVWDNTSVTIAGWFREANAFAFIGNNTKYRFSVGGGLWDMGVIAQNNNEFVGYIRNDVGVEIDIPSGVTVSSNVFYFILIQFDFVGRTIGISVDGSSIVTAGFGGTTTAQVSCGFSARNQGNSGSFDYDEFGIWYRLLTAAEITFLYNSGAGRTYPDVPSP